MVLEKNSNVLFRPFIGSGCELDTCNLQIVNQKNICRDSLLSEFLCFHESKKILSKNFSVISEKSANFNLVKVCVSFLLIFPLL